MLPRQLRDALKGRVEPESVQKLDAYLYFPGLGVDSDAMRIVLAGPKVENGKREVVYADGAAIEIAEGAFQKHIEAFQIQPE